METSTASALVIEDDPLFGSIVDHFLSKWQLLVVKASTMESARALMAGRSFDLYLIDHRLPDGDSSDLFLAGAGTSALESRCVVLTSFPIVAGYMLPFPIVDKMSLHLLWPHLVRILGPPLQTPSVGCTANTPETDAS